MNYAQNGYNSAFSHIYVEERILSHPRTQKILAHFPNAQVISIGHYKDVFCRRGQQYVQQHQAQNLILAKKEDHFIYEGAKPCQDFGNEHLYYCSTMMNCMFDCSYCYLKGMYPSGHMVIFVNLEDYFEKLEEMLAKSEIYLCVSYDADLLAMDSLTGYASAWADFAKKHGNLKIEIRTKSARMEMWEQCEPASNVIYAFTVAPEEIIAASEKKTPSAKARIACAAEGVKRGFAVRLCFDPMLYLPNWKEYYGNLLEAFDQAFVEKGCRFSDVMDVSVGAFRISQDYMKKIRRVEPDSVIVQFPFVNEGGIYQYPRFLLERMEQYLVEELEKRIPRNRIFLDRE